MRNFANPNQRYLQKILPVTQNVLVVHIYKIKKRLHGSKRKDTKLGHNSFAT